jgi:hypothetical protein
MQDVRMEKGQMDVSQPKIDAAIRDRDDTDASVRSVSEDAIDDMPLSEFRRKHGLGASAARRVICQLGATLRPDPTDRRRKIVRGASDYFSKDEFESMFSASELKKISPSRIGRTDDASTFHVLCRNRTVVVRTEKPWSRKATKKLLDRLRQLVAAPVS